MQSIAFVLTIFVGAKMVSAWISTRTLRPPPTVPSFRMKMITSTSQKTYTENNPAGFSTHVLDHIDAALDTFASLSNGQSLSSEEIQALVTSLEVIIDDAQSSSFDNDNQRIDTSTDNSVADDNNNNEDDVISITTGLESVPVAPVVTFSSSPQSKPTLTTTASSNYREAKSYGTRSKHEDTNIKPTGYSSGGLSPAISSDISAVVTDVNTATKPWMTKSNSRSSGSSGHNNGSPKSYGTRSKYVDSNVKPTGYSSGGLSPAWTTSPGPGVVMVTEPLSSAHAVSMTREDNDSDSDSDSDSATSDASDNAVFLVNTVLSPSPSSSPSPLPPVSPPSPSPVSPSPLLQGGVCDMTMIGHEDFVLNVFQLHDLQGLGLGQGQGQGGLCSVDTKGTIKTWDLVSGQCQTTMMGHSGEYSG